MFVSGGRRVPEVRVGFSVPSFHGLVFFSSHRLDASQTHSLKALSMQARVMGVRIRRRDRNRRTSPLYRLSSPDFEQEQTATATKKARAKKSRCRFVSFRCRRRFLPGTRECAVRWVPSCRGVVHGPGSIPGGGTETATVTRFSNTDRASVSGDTLFFFQYRAATVCQCDSPRRARQARDRTQACLRKQLMWMAFFGQR